MFNITFLQADILLKGSPILGQVESIKSLLQYKTEEGYISLDDYYTKLTREIDGIHSFDLKSEIPPGTEYAYLLSITNTYQEILDNLERLSVKAIFFQGKLKTIQKQIESASATFGAWYQIAVTQELKEQEIKIPASAVKALGDSEFVRILGNSALDVESMIESLNIQIGVLKSHKNLCNEKYKMAKDQVNASLSNFIPQNDFGNEQIRRPSYNKLEEKYGKNFIDKPPVNEEEDDDEPVSFVPKKKVEEKSTGILKTSIVETKPVVVGEVEIENKPKKIIDSFAGEVKPLKEEVKQEEVKVITPEVKIETRSEEITTIKPGAKPSLFNTKPSKIDEAQLRFNKTHPSTSRILPDIDDEEVL